MFVCPTLGCRTASRCIPTPYAPHQKPGMSESLCYHDSVSIECFYFEDQERETSSGLWGRYLFLPYPLFCLHPFMP